MEKPLNNTPQELLKDLPLNEDSNVIDIGGYMGEYSRVMKDYYKSKITIYEPVFFDKIKIPDAIIINKAVSNHNGETDIYINADGTSLYSSWCKGQRRRVQCVRASEIGGSDLLKINCEGAEYDILTDLYKTDSMKNHKLIFIQFHKLHHRSFLDHSDAWEQLMKTHERQWMTGLFVWEFWERKQQE